MPDETFKHLLVPLDGTKMAEIVLPAVVDIARSCAAKVTLLHVIERRAGEQVHGQRHLKDAAEARQYLQSVAATMPSGVKTGWHVHEEAAGDLALSLAWHAQEFRPDLVIMCEHGRAPLRDRLFGNVAQQVVHRDATPLLLLWAGPDGKAVWPIRHVLVPLDGQPEHEKGLDAAAALAGICSAPILLLTVVQTASTLAGAQAAAGALLPHVTQELLDMAEQQAAEYLSQLALRLQSRGICASGRVVRGAPAEMILQTAAEKASDLIVMGTHGKAGTRAFWEGSVAPVVLRRAKASFLLALASEHA
ncbi:MAG: universal stress protein [Planctomycetes bacterium]|nr:universal stress protein [Planctomycetota bacterium]